HPRTRGRRNHQLPDGGAGVPLAEEVRHSARGVHVDPGAADRRALDGSAARAAVFRDLGRGAAQSPTRARRARGGGGGGVDDRRRHRLPRCTVLRRHPAAQYARWAVNGLLVQGLRVAFGARAVVDGVDVSVGPGEWTSVVGPNGAGKTTLLHAIAGMTRPAAGTITLDGH